MHIGIYAPLAEDAVSESKAAAMGGVTSSLNYFRTGQYYLNRGGPYAKFFPEVLKQSEGQLPRRLRLPPGADGQPRTSTRWSIWSTQHGVPSFKIFMFYGGTGCTARRRSRASS